MKWRLQIALVLWVDLPAFENTESFHFLETAYFTSKPILSTQNIDKKSQ